MENMLLAELDVACQEGDYDNAMDIFGQLDTDDDEVLEAAMDLLHEAWPDQY